MSLMSSSETLLGRSGMSRRGEWRREARRVLPQLHQPWFSRAEMKQHCVANSQTFDFEERCRVQPPSVTVHRARGD